MNDEQTKLLKRRKWMRITLLIWIVIAVSYLIRLIFFPEDNFRIFMDGLLSFLNIGIAIGYWFQLKKINKQLQHLQISESNQF